MNARQDPVGMGRKILGKGTERQDLRFREQVEPRFMIHLLLATILDNLAEHTR
jgi:hypothetical protein